jgi:AcrR family transcriptional regulator
MVTSRPARPTGVSGFRATKAHSGCGRLVELQRSRMVGATFDVVAERGAGNMTVAHVVERSGVSRRTFYENFEDREDCLLASFERALTLASQRIVPAYESEKAWQQRIRAALIALLAFCDEQPNVVRMLVCESQASGPRVAQRRRDILAQITKIVHLGRKEGKAEHLSSLAAEGIVGGVLAVIQTRLTDAERKPLISLTNGLMSMIVLPYLGAAAARRELELVTPVSYSETAERTLLGDPFKEAGMRLTYRTVRALMAIAEHPGASNRLIGDVAEIADQGQVSKLLGRLKRAGMVANTGLGACTGTPNAWTLTSAGRQVTDSIGAQTENDQSHAVHER